MKPNRLALSLIALCVTACSNDDSEGSGKVEFSTWGEEYIEQGIPADDVEDGWSIRYRKFLVVIGSVRIADASGAVGSEMKTSKLFDMTKPGVKPVVTFDGVPAKAWTHVSYRVSPISGDSALAGASEADKQLMASGGFSIYVDAVATKAGATKTFSWGFRTDTLYDRCEGELGGKKTEGVVVTNGGTDQPQITVHGDHLFYDDLQAEEAKVRFQNIADADRDGDGTITLEELASVKLASLPSDKSKGSYGTGSATGINDLSTFVTALSRTLGHFRGEGECFASSR